MWLSHRCTVIFVFLHWSSTPRPINVECQSSPWCLSCVPLVLKNALLIMHWPIYQMWPLFFLFISPVSLCNISCCVTCTELAMLACLYLQFSYCTSFIARALCLWQSPPFNGTTSPSQVTSLHSAWVYVILVSLTCGNVHKYSYNTFYRCFRNFGSHPFEHNECHMFVSVHVTHQMNGFLRKSI